MATYGQKSGPPPSNDYQHYNPAFISDPHTPDQPPPYSAHPQQPSIQPVQRPLPQPKRHPVQHAPTMPSIDMKAIVCGAVFLLLAFPSLVMFIVFVTTFPESMLYLSLPIQCALCLISGALLIAAGKKFNHLMLVNGCGIFFGVCNVIVAFFHIGYVGSVLGDGSASAGKSGGVASMIVVLVVGIIIVIVSFLSLLLTCHSMCSAKSHSNSTV